MDKNSWKMAGILAIATLCGTTAQAGTIRDQAGGDDYVPTGKGWGEHLSMPRAFGQAGARAVQGANGINYHGGPLILGTANVYYIWYGNWAGNSATTLLPLLAHGLGGSPYFNINTTYYDGNNAKVSNAVSLAGQTSDNYSKGTALTDTNVRDIVANAITTNALPKDPNGVYFVLTTSDVNETSGFCTQYCGWHTHSLISGTDIKYSFVGNAERCPSACSAQTVSPNGNVGADAMASVISHELEEAVTDPDLNAWYDKRGSENADKCAWTFGQTYTAASGSSANMNLSGKDFLIQQNWVNDKGGYCAVSY